MAHDAELTALWTAQAADDKGVGQQWLDFVAAADAAHIADRIPGTVGRRFRQVYAEQPATKEAVAKATTRKAAAKKTPAKKPTTRKSAAKKAAK